MENQKFILIILDGWGIGDGSKSGDELKVKTPVELPKVNKTK